MNLVCGSIMIFDCPNMFRMFAKFVFVSLTHDASVLVENALVSNRLDYCNSFFSSPPGSIYINYSASKIVQVELY